MADLRFHLFRLSLRERNQPDLFVESDKLSRSDWIRHLFSTRADFNHHGAEFIYIPRKQSLDTRYLIGGIGREISEIEHTDPDDGYREYIHDSWKVVEVIVDPDEHEDGQKVAIQFHPSVGKPSSLARRLVAALDDAQEHKHYLTSIHPITNSGAFWDFVARNEGRITKIRFELEVPNMFGGEDEYDREMRAFREKENAQKVIIEIKNPDGVDPHTERVRFTADKAMNQGTGKVTAKAVGKSNSFTSEEQQLSSKVSIPDITTDERKPEIIFDYAESILGRDKN